MTRRRAVRIGTLGVLLGLAGWLGYTLNPTTTSELDALFREQIPIGSSENRVAAFLDSRGVEHGVLPVYK